MSHLHALAPDRTRSAHGLATALVFTLATAIAAPDSSAQADGPFARLTTRALPSTVVTPGLAAVGDIDGDGDLDVLLPSVSDIDRLFRNDGDGVFADITQTSLPSLPGWSHAATFVDVDGDGDLDALVAGNSGYQTRGSQNRLLENDGSGNFTDITQSRLPVDEDKTVMIEGADFDADGDEDLLVLNSASGFNGAQNRLYLNDGAGRFTDVTTTHLPADPDTTGDVTVADFDGDGDLDFIIGVLFDSRPVRVFNNDGTGRFTPTRGGQLPPLPRNGYTIHEADLDGDGDLDLLGLVGQQLTVLINDGAGNFSDQTGTRAPIGYGYPHVIGDFDGDGDIDAVTSVTPALGGGVRMLRNDGSGNFSYAARISDSAATELAFDFDADGDLDLLSQWTFDVLLNDGSGNFLDRLQTLERRAPDFDGRPERAALADIDGDGDIDAWLTGSTVDGDRLLLGDGRGRFTDASQNLPRAGTRSGSVALADVDGDGDLDAVVGSASSAEPTRLLLGDGLGGFLEAPAGRMPPTAAQTTDVLLIDVDGDTDLDLLEVNYWHSSALFLNDGFGSFSAAPTGSFPSDDSLSRVAVAFDAQGDGALDLVITSYGGASLYYINDGLGNFTRADPNLLPIGNPLSWDAAAVDVDGDGDIDLVAPGDRQTTGLWINDGTGAFTAAASGRMPTNVPSRFIHAVDDDRDGDVDLVLAGIDRTVLLRNDGTGTFQVHQDRAFAGLAVACGDVDFDADPDLILVSQDGPVHVATHLLRELHFGTLPRVGRTTRIDVHAYDQLASGAAAVIALAPLDARVPIGNFGVLGLDPATMSSGLAVAFTNGADIASIPLPIPADPRLLGAQVFAQAMVFDGREARLSNTLAARVQH